MENIKKTRKRGGKHRSRNQYSISFRRMVARQYLDTDQSLADVAQKFGVTKVDVSNWQKLFSSELAEDEKKIIVMTEQEKQDFILLKKQNEALKKKLEYEQMRNFALETMVDLAKTELGIDLRKNSDAKQPEE